ncbi:MAG: hypothetical protein M3Q55_10910 [Acidobacteriota bacterium]|nr:hypothetical protein [Acidobacteriota bacterium]
MSSKPHSLTVSAAAALYDSMLQRALQQFFSRAALETEVVPAQAGSSEMAIEPTGDASAIVVTWFEFRHTLRVAPERPFTPDEVRFARGIVSVLDARYRAIFDPALMAERLDLFRGAVEDRYIGAFLDDVPYTLEHIGRADVIAQAVEVLRVAALSRYENREISSGVLLLDTATDPARGACRTKPTLDYAEGLTSVKSFYRLSDGLHTAFLVNRDGKVLDIVDVDEWDARAGVRGTLDVPVARPYQAHARATEGNHHISIILTPSHEIRVFAGGAQVFTFRNASWHLLDIAAKYDMWQRAVGNEPLARLIFQTALDLADMRQGALFVVLRDAAEGHGGVADGLARLVAPADRLDLPHDHEPSDGRIDRRDLLHFAVGRTVTDLSPDVFRALSTMDGAIVTDQRGRLLAAGAILLHSGPASVEIEGARTAAAFGAAQYGPILKVSEDGHMTCFDQGRLWEI